MQFTKTVLTKDVPMQCVGRIDRRCMLYTVLHTLIVRLFAVMIAKIDKRNKNKEHSSNRLNRCDQQISGSNLKICERMYMYTFYNVHTHACCYSTNFKLLLLLLLSCKTAVNVFIFAHSFPYHTVFSSEPYFFCRTKTKSRELTKENTKRGKKLSGRKGMTRTYKIHRISPDRNQYQ